MIGEARPWRWRRRILVVVVSADIARVQAGHNEDGCAKYEGTERLKHPTDDQSADQGLLEIRLVQFVSRTHAPGSEW